MRDEAAAPCAKVGRGGSAISEGAHGFPLLNLPVIAPGLGPAVTADMVIWPSNPTKTPFFSIDAEDITFIDHLMIILGI